MLPIVITALRVNGNSAPVSELGVTKLENLVFAPEQNTLQIDFLSLDFSTATTLHYQYRLNEQEWGAPSDLRTVNFASLAPGAYRFAARAVSDSGMVSDPPVTITFTILHPLWLREWFLALLAATLGLLVYGAYRYRVAQIVAVERMRLRIAADLHDDVGANLSLIAGVSEMLTLQNVPSLQAPLAQIAEASRRSMEAMSDIVWMINPGKDHFSDFVQRLRRFASERLGARQIALQFIAPELEDDVHLSEDSRRELFLLCKEAINNCARHAACTRVEITLALQGDLIHVTITDDGRGFDPAHTNSGNGLPSMQQRVAQLGGQWQLRTAPGQGTEIHVQVPGHLKRGKKIPVRIHSDERL